MTNQHISDVLNEISQRLEVKEIPFKPQAYEKAASAIAGLDKSVMQIYKDGGIKALEEMPGVGKSIAEKIEELIKTGRLKYYEQLKKKMPADISELTSVEGLGPKQAVILYKKLKIKNIKQLERSARAGKIRKLKGFGEKKEANIIKSIEFLKESGGRLLLGQALPLARTFKERLEKLKGVKKVEVTGSLRRRKETVGDIDMVVALKSGTGKVVAEKLSNFFASMPEVTSTYARGPTKTLVRLKNGIDADLRIVPEKSFGATLNYFTGSKEHNIALREMAIRKGWKFNEYGLFKDKKQIAGKTEEEIYKKLGMDYIEPEMREMAGEIELAQKKKLPDLINYGDLRGDLQIQTSWSDGANSIEDMAKKAKSLGLEYILITDHSKRLAMANGLNKKRLLKQIKEIDKINKKFQVLKGIECDILKDGQMDLDDEILSKLDIVGGAIHSFFNLSEKEQTERIKKAMNNPNVDIIFHPTGRIINRRPAYKVDIDELIKHAKKTKTVLEIDAYPDRLDLKDDYIFKCVEAGVKMSISTDAHSIGHLEFLEYGIAQARRGWASKKDIINAWPLRKMMGMLKNV